ncbi:hypothetical protein BJ546DRAFT_179759 [Cryomyces antarcticus]|uniref:Uncharacterized protein n=1 Tax=Cryomyces antarcticus TaxID=329879 RepID=A0ABR0M9A9_9PEZI|nr:hypothetical protein LTR39_000486 [Cryomyces antarcticus]KAK5020236.1 hypothetical protein LTR60_000700 [Cryomyces antarcticus]KAK5138699.1 hypothetical protein LTR04_004278 [Oleoguttula sp. CCFEE 6159]KAK5296634.1 hypothetical protein LTR16_000455 [Cryomyces antarcticus]
MARIDYYASSPTVVLPPQQQSHYFADKGATSTQSVFTNPYYQPALLAQGSNATQSSYAPSSEKRKRSYADIQDPDEADAQDGSFTTAVATPSKPRGEPVMGPGMTLIYPDDPKYTRAIDAASQTGTWAETTAASRTPQATHTQASLRPITQSRKSSRMDPSAPGPDDVALLIAPTTRREPHQSPPIDAITARLGISWSQIPPALLASAIPAWTLYITKHYPLSNVRFLFHQRNLPAYCVAAVCEGREGHYLFTDDLKRAQLVAYDVDAALANLSMDPMGFEGDKVLDATESDARGGAEQRAGGEPDAEMDID